MRLRSLIMMTGAAFVALPAAAAQDEPGEDKVMRHEVRAFAFAGADTREEAAKRAGERFDRRDKNKDGYLDAEERVPAMLRHRERMAGMPPMPHAMGMKHDPAEMFDKMDTDKNGAISREEFDAHHEAMNGEHGMHAMMLPDADGEGHKRVMIRTLELDGDADLDEETDRIVSQVIEDENLEPGENVIVRRIEGGKDGTWHGKDGGKHRMMRLGRAMERWEDSDTDKDGRISRDEAIATALARFDEADTNGNGKIDEDERNVVVERIVKRD
ncbi:EF-hand domain-containing protein [Sphingomicrobium nitratireducens]|uniref:EF-hand domain-containing protein n=1 Tax=Sphingomicrobium nitratireducens TaxID=2964666 RepID=UPI00223F4920|nr:EF-hand domain-containing protein [Sphingomicrobium nitratireducens]